jgi:hypothetical protein
MADDFQTGAELNVSVSSSSLRDARRTIESELGDIEVDVIASLEGGGAVGSRSPEAPGIDLSRRQLGELERANEYLEVMTEDLDDLAAMGGGGDGDGTSLGGLARGLGAGVGSGLGLTALGIGAGAGIGGLGIGAGLGLATGNIQLPEESITLDAGDITLSPTFESVPVTIGEGVSLEPTIGPEDINVVLGDEAFEFSPVFDPSMFDIQTQVMIGEDAFDFSPTFEPEFSPVFEPEFSPQFEPVFKPEFSATFEPQLDVTTDLRANLNISPSFTFSPTLNLTGVDLGGLADDVEQAIIGSRDFQNEVERISGDIVDDLVAAINRQTGLNLSL